MAGAAPSRNPRCATPALCRKTQPPPDPSPLASFGLGSGGGYGYYTPAHQPVALTHRQLNSGAGVAQRMSGGMGSGGPLSAHLAMGGMGRQQALQTDRRQSLGMGFRREWGLG